MAMATSPSRLDPPRVARLKSRRGCAAQWFVSRLGPILEIAGAEAFAGLEQNDEAIHVGAYTAHQSERVQAIDVGFVFAQSIAASPRAEGDEFRRHALEPERAV